jgi:T3SS negative regulator,GrlR
MRHRQHAASSKPEEQAGWTASWPKSCNVFPYRRTAVRLGPKRWLCWPKSKTIVMIRNGLYSVSSKLLDGAEGGSTGVSVLRDGTMRGGGSIYYHVGSYVCSGGKWKGELTIREHTPAEITRTFAGHVVSMGFNGTYTEDDAEFRATALAGKQSVQLEVVFRLLAPD